MSRDRELPSPETVHEDLRETGTTDKTVNRVPIRRIRHFPAVPVKWTLEGIFMAASSHADPCHSRESCIRDCLHPVHRSL
ncbi:hypothetical protein ASZ90_010730 [hydrocarbon metagenome]|uniref:Uncharacterized protein n=1 Tax=hydrocarbon metagenome TaxID=938273 RepID=A0A0W8FFQ7_9ZZZZ